MRLNVDGIDTFYGETQALFDVTLTVGIGEVVALLGPNGAGKTTILRSVLGLTPARRGRIQFDGTDITRAEVHTIARAGVGWVPDDRRIFPGLTVARNLEIARKAGRFRSWTIEDLFGFFPSLRHLMAREADNLSGGEAQMVAIARALLGSPGLLLLDEPTQGLAPRIAQIVMQLVAQMRGESLSVLLVEQNAQTALAVSDRVYAINGGRIVHHGPAAELAADGNLRSRILGVR
jgi:branched-chain amino acid transport system ATP-binding protein